MIAEFKAFVSKGSLVELAVAFVMGLAFAAVVTAFTTVVLSFVGAIFGGDVSFDELAFRLNGTPIPYGGFLTALVNFLIIAFVLFLVVKAYNRFKEQEESLTRPCPRCATDIRKEATRCPACTSDVQVAV